MGARKYPHPPPGRRGVTLVELLVSAAILSIVLMAATGVLLAQNAQYVRASGQREAREQGMAALEALQRAVRLAGFGMDPHLAFDFDHYNCNLGSAGGGIPQSARCAAAQRDGFDQADELVLYYRDPNYRTSPPPPPLPPAGCPGSPGITGNAWRVLAATTASIALEMRAGQQIFRGQILQVICQDSATYTYVTVSAPSPVINNCANVTLNLEGPLTTNGPTGAVTSPFSLPGLLSNPCFANGNARAFLVSRNRFFVYQDASRQPARPFLMLDQGLDISGAGGVPDGQLTEFDLVPIASDIEDLQVSYVLDQVGILQSGAAITQATYFLDDNQDGIWGNNLAAAAAEQLTANAAAAAPYDVRGTFNAANTRLGGTSQPCENSTQVPFRDPCLLDKPSLEMTGANVHPYRWTPWAGNIVQVRLNLVSRSALPTAQSTGLSPQTADVGRLAPLENRPLVDLVTAPGWYAPTAPARYQRSYFSGASRPINLSTNGLFTF